MGSITARNFHSMLSIRLPSAPEEFRACCFGLASKLLKSALPSSRYRWELPALLSNMSRNLIATLNALTVDNRWGNIVGLQESKLWKNALLSSKTDIECSIQKFSCRSVRSRMSEEWKAQTFRSIIWIEPSLYAISSTVHHLLSDA